MNWVHLRRFPWLDTRARFVAASPQGGALLDLGSSDGLTLGHMAELRPDLRLFAVDRDGLPERYPTGCQFHRADLERDRLPWTDASMDAITCMHLVEHLRELGPMLRECARLLKPGARVYFETPHPKSLTLSSPSGAAAGSFTLNFFDDPTHVQVVPVGALAQAARLAGLQVATSGISRNWLFVAAYPFLWPTSNTRQRLTAKVHWLGWSAYLIAQRPL